ncbi:YIEGIA domain-containing protein, partial [Clostridioides difficile]|uniref:YIEGIA domain-containing protein n=1 Tax=Clostridioides difficile TaxID=1496 RepID=UPI002358316D
KESDEPALTPIPRKDTGSEAIYIAFIPMEKDERKVIEAVKSCPILDSARGKHLALRNLRIEGKESK